MKKQTASYFSCTACDSCSAISVPRLSPLRDYSFTISTTQPWTDTGVDLQAGDTIEVTATPAHAAEGTSGNVATHAERVVPINLVPVFW